MEVGREGEGGGTLEGNVGGGKGLGHRRAKRLLGFLSFVCRMG